jgi:hypothetical protein
VVGGVEEKIPHEEPLADGGGGRRSRNSTHDSMFSPLLRSRPAWNALGYIGNMLTGEVVVEGCGEMCLESEGERERENTSKIDRHTHSHTHTHTHTHTFTHTTSARIPIQLFDEFDVHGFQFQRSYPGSLLL